MHKDKLSVTLQAQCTDTMADVYNKGESFRKDEFRLIHIIRRLKRLKVKDEIISHAENDLKTIVKIKEFFKRLYEA